MIGNFAKKIRPHPSAEGLPGILNHIQSSTPQNLLPPQKNVNQKQMIYNFRIVSDEADNFRREISIDADNTFLQLRNAICDSVGYDKGQMNSFFLCDDNWEKEREITLEDMGTDSDQEIFLMDETPLIDLIEEKGQRMIFVFDYLTDRCFFMELKKIEPQKDLDEPVCTLSQGTPPPQFIDLNAFEDAIDAKAAKAAADDMDFDEFEHEDDYGEEDLAGLSDDVDLY